MPRPFARSLPAAALALAAGLASAADAPYTVYAAGDIAYCDKTTPALSGAADTAALVAAALAADARAAVLLLGDNVYQRGTAGEYARCYHPTGAASRRAPIRRPATTNTPRAARVAISPTSARRQGAAITASGWARGA
jgi:hypothetical protein